MTHISRRALLIAGTASAVLSPYVARGAGPVTLRMSTPDGVTHPNGVAIERFASLVEQKTKGAIVVKVFPDAQLGTMANAVSGMQMGTIDFAISSPGLFEGLVPRMGILNFPFLFRDEKTAEGVLDSDVGTKLFTELSPKGVEGLCWSTYGWRVTETRNRIIREPRDFEGLKIRLPPGPVLSDSFRTLGAIPTVVDASELYLAVSQGTVDAFEVPILSLVASKWYEVIKNVSLTNHSYNPLFLAASSKRLSSLPADQQTAIRDSANEIKQFWRKLVVDKTVELRKFVEDRGIAINDTNFDAFRTAVQPVYTRYRDKLGPDFVDSFLKKANG